MSSLLRHTPEGFRKEYLSKCSQRFEQKGGSYTRLGIYESLDYQPVPVQVFPPSFYERYNANNHDEVLAKLASEKKLDKLNKMMVEMGVVYYGPYLKENAENPSATKCMWWICTGSNTTYQTIHANATATATTAGRPVRYQDFVFPVPPDNFTEILKDISKGGTYKNSPGALTEVQVDELSDVIINDLGKLAF